MREGTLLFVLVGPVVELGVGPYVLTGFEAGDGLPGAIVVRVAGGVLLAGCLLVLADAFVRFARAGGTPSPLAPPAAPVRDGVYALLRHPMYTATTLGFVGEALLLRQSILLIAAGLYATTMAILVAWIEEPRLRQRFGERWRSERGRDRA